MHPLSIEREESVCDGLLKMESRNGNGGNTTMKQLPVGFRFRPTDEELLQHYLKRKICSLPLPANVIHESDVFRFSPWDLPGDMKEKRYFFCKRQSNNTVNKCSVTADCGYWKYTGKHKQVTSSAGANGKGIAVIGLKRSLVFYKRRHEKTRWMMHEFCLVGCVSYPSSNSTQKLMMQVGGWLVCLVYQKKTRNRGRVTEKKDGLGCNKSINCSMLKDDELGFSSAAQTQTTSPCSSVITEVSSSCEGIVDQEATSRS